MRELRALSTSGRMPNVCPQPECQRSKRCRGPLKVSEFGGDHAIPYCFAVALDYGYAPVHRWTTFWKQLEQAAATLEAEGGASG